ncbi:MAG: pilus assembly protein [Azospirillum brasilense]|nr:MAG: pilus assembly protein [Azospirillum brasilense]
MRSFLARIAALFAAYTLAMQPVYAQQSTNFYEALGYQGAAPGVIDVEINKGAPLRLPSAAASVAVADPEIADVQVISPKMLYVNGRGIGETSVIAVDASDNIILESTVNVTHNLSRLKRAAEELSPNNDVVATSTDNAIILKGKVESPVAAEKIQRMATSFLQGEGQQVINMLDTSATDQVMLKVKIVEVARNELKRFGINWESLINAGSGFVFGVGQGRDFVNDTNGYVRGTNGDNSLFAGYRGSDANINAAIDALEQDGLISVLAEPNLTTRSGTAANFLAGGEYPIPVPGQNGTVTIEYRQFGVSLQFTPVVLSPEKISLSVLPEVSALSMANAVTLNGTTVPGLTTRRASTTVDLGTGQSFAIAGLLRNDQGTSVDKFPFLGDVPVLGALFRSSEFQNNQTELVILVTPYIVKPVDKPELLATPLDGHKPATDGERILLGRLHNETPKYKNSAKPEVTTPASAFDGIGGQAGFLIR